MAGASGSRARSAKAQLSNLSFRFRGHLRRIIRMTKNPKPSPTAQSEAVEIARARQIKLILMDCDGVLTDGRIILLPDGEELKNFHVHDGQGVTLAKQAGLRVGVISGRRSRVLERRACENRFDFIIQQADNKLAAYHTIVRQAGVEQIG